MSSCRGTATVESPWSAEKSEPWRTNSAPRQGCEYRDDVLHLRDLHNFSELSGTRAPVVEHNGHDNLVQEQHLGDLHGKCTVCTVRTCCSRRENCRSLSLHEAATSATVEELQQRQFHGFWYCLDQPHLSSTATGMSTLVQELHGFQHCLDHEGQSLPNTGHEHLVQELRQ